MYARKSKVLLIGANDQTTREKIHQFVQPLRENSSFGNLPLPVDVDFCIFNAEIDGALFKFNIFGTKTSEIIEFSARARNYLANASCIIFFNIDPAKSEAYQKNCSCDCKFIDYNPSLSPQEHLRSVFSSNKKITDTNGMLFNRKNKSKQGLESQNRAPKVEDDIKKQTCLVM